METLPVVIFRYKGKYAHFRRPYTNVSSLSYPFPPRPTISGLLGAILGIKKDEVAETFKKDNLKVAVKIEQEIKTITHVTNFRQDGFGGIDYSIKKPKNGWKPKELKNIPPYNQATQIPMELLYHPSFLIYVHLVDNIIFNEFISRLKTERYFYTPCLGLSEFLATIEYIDIKDAVLMNKGEYTINSIIAKDDCILIRERLESEKHHIQELKVPYLGTAKREFNYRRYILNIKPEAIPVNMKVDVFKVFENIISFM